MQTTADGYASGPNGELDWFDPSKADGEMHEDIVSLVKSADTWIMGYPTGAGLTAYWKSVENRGEADEWEMEIARAVNNLKAVIISNKPERPIDGTEIIVAKNDNELVDAVAKIKSGSGRDIYVPGGVRTAQNFSRFGLIDEYTIFVHPITIGDGKKLFSDRIELELVSAKSYKSGVIQIRYRPRA